MRWLISLFILFALSSVGFSATLHVPGTYPTIQQGIDAALNGDTVLVAPGTYVENIDFTGKAITVKSSGGAEMTWIDGNQAGSVVKFIHGETLSSVLDGFSITNGTGTFDTYLYYRGGGIYCHDHSSPSIRNNRIFGNSAEIGCGVCCNKYSSPLIAQNSIFENSNTGTWINGGGICCDHDSSPTITDNLIFGNAIHGKGVCGGGIFCYLDSSPIIKNNTISDNKAIGDDFGYGGGLFIEAFCSPIIKNNEIVRNAVSGNKGFGGGIYFKDCQPTIIGNIIANNSAERYGGGVYGDADLLFAPRIEYNRISENTVSGPYGRGGGVYFGDIQLNLANNTISGNSVFGIQGSGGGLFFGFSSEVKITNTTIFDNSADNFGGGIHCYHLSATDIIDSILWDNNAPQGPEALIEFSTVTIAYSDVDGGKQSIHLGNSATLNWGQGMIDKDPLFIAGPHGFLYLSHTAAGQTKQSPCVDAGSDLSSNLKMDTLWTATDKALDSGMVDMGFHYGPFSSTWSVPLHPDIYSLPVAFGGTVNFLLNAGKSNALRNYMLLGSVTGTSPGTMLPGGKATLPINWDLFTTLTISMSNTLYFKNFAGALDPDGMGVAQLNFPSTPGLAGLVMNFAYALNAPWDFASNATAIELVP